MIDVHYVALFTSSITSYGINKAPKYARYRIEAAATRRSIRRALLTQTNCEYLIAYTMYAQHARRASLVSFAEYMSHSTSSLN